MRSATGKKNRQFIKWFKDIRIEDVPLVGGKNAALGEMCAKLVPLGINVPNGFAITAAAYDYFLEGAGLKREIKRALHGLDTKNLRDLASRGAAVRRLILRAELPADLGRAIAHAYAQLEKLHGKSTDVAVRSSATAEDLPGASFAGQQETYLNVVGIGAVLRATKKCIASLFTNRAISYRADKGFSHFKVALSVGIQKMARSDLAASGVAFTLDTETGFDRVIVINGSYGLGEMIVQGKVTPDEFVVFKPTLKTGHRAIIGKELGMKTVKLVYGKRGTEEVGVPDEDRKRMCITDAEALTLARWCLKIEEYFSKKHKRYQPMDIEWAKDGKTGALFIVQARPETVHSRERKNVYGEYQLKKRGSVIVSGIAVGKKIASGAAHIIQNPKHILQFKKGQILVTEITDPDWEPIMKIAAGIVTDKGGRTSHAAIVSRELGIPCIVGTERGTRAIKAGEVVTLDCSSGQTGTVYRGVLPFRVLEHHLDKIPRTRTKIMVNIGTPSEAFENHFLPTKGVGLGRLEFIIAGGIKIHPNALIDYGKLQRAKRKSPAVRKLLRKIDDLTAGYEIKTDYYVDKLAEGIARIGAAFWPHEVIIRFSDFKTNEYRTLLGGDRYEPAEENPMLGWRGASRYYDPKFTAAFALECRAMKKVRSEMGLVNVVPMVPFCRTPDEGKKTLAIMERAGLSRTKDKTLKVYVMCEIPSNILRADEFLDIFDGMSIGSNDLTQLTLGLDRDSGMVSHVANENDPSVKKLIAEVIAKCRARKKYIGICGQAPSDYPEFAKFLVKNRIGSISLNPDTVIRTILAVAKTEK